MGSAAQINAMKQVASRPKVELHGLRTDRLRPGRANAAPAPARRHYHGVAEAEAEFLELHPEQFHHGLQRFEVATRRPPSFDHCEKGLQPASRVPSSSSVGDA